MKLVVYVIYLKVIRKIKFGFKFIDILSIYPRVERQFDIFLVFRNISLLKY